MGYKRKEIKKWSDIQRILKKPRDLKEKMDQLAMGEDVEKKGGKGQDRWKNCKSAVQSFDFKSLEQRSAAPIKILTRWYNAVNMTHNIALAVSADNKPIEHDPVADRIFDTIDADGNQFITTQELVKYMLREYPDHTDLAHRLLRVLDEDMDGKISRDEWQAGWNKGEMDKLLKKVVAEQAQQGGRLNRRRAGATDMTVAAAARNWNASQASHINGGGATGSNGPGPKPFAPLPGIRGVGETASADTGSKATKKKSKS